MLKVFCFAFYEPKPFCFFWNIHVEENIEKHLKKLTELYRLMLTYKQTISIFGELFVTNHKLLIRGSYASNLMLLSIACHLFPAHSTYYIFLAHLSRRLTGELKVYPCSSVRPTSVRPSFTISKIFSSETAWPIKAKLHVEHPLEGGTKVYINGPGHMTKMAAMAINSKNL